MQETSKKIKLIHVVESFGAGTLSMLSMICRCLDENIFDVVILYSNREETPLDFKSMFPEHVKFQMVNMGKELSLKNDFISFIKIKNILKSRQPDIVHLHSSKAGFLGRAACRLLNIHRVYYSPQGFSFLRTDVGYIKRCFFYYLEKLAMLFGGTIVVSSESERKEAYKLSNSTITINNVVDIDEIDKITSVLKNDSEIKVGISGRITFQRWPELFVSIANTVIKTMPTVKFLWIGDGELRHILEKNNIEITGWKKRNEAIGLLKSLDIYLHTSKWEGLPVAILEAMASGIPVVCTNIIGNKDVVLHGITGYLANTEEEFVKYILELVKDKNLRKVLGLKGRKRIEENFEMRNLSTNLKKLYLDIS